MYLYGLCTTAGRYSEYQFGSDSDFTHHIGKIIKEAGTRIFKLYRSSNHWAKLGRENFPHRFFVCFRGANNKFQAAMSKSGDNSTLKIVNCAYSRTCALAALI